MTPTTHNKTRPPLKARLLTGIAIIIVSSSALMSASPSVAQNSENGARIKDLARFAGIQSNALIGYGLVIGLPGTGDSAASISTNKSAALMLSRLGATASPDEVSTKNIAAVLVTAELRPFARIGDRIQVRVSSVGDSKSLQGGTLILTPLKAANGQVFATAQGHLSTGTSQAGATGGKSASESSIRTVALTDGGTVERVFETSVLQQGELQLSLMEPDFTTASRIAQAINSYYSSFIASAANSAQVSVAIPEGIFGNPSFQLVDFVATLEQIRVAPDSRARIVIAERTGTIILGSEVRIAPVAISHGFLEVKVENKIGRVGELTSTATIGELVSSLNALGAGPKDLVSIIQALAKSGAIQADLIYM